MSALAAGFLGGVHWIGGAAASGLPGHCGRIDAPREPLPCGSVFTEAHITWDGKLSACAFEAADPWIMADLNDTSFADGWASAAFARLRDAHLRRDLAGTACGGCTTGS